VLVFSLANAAELEAFSPDDEAFSPLQEATKTYCLSVGTMRYTQRIVTCKEEDIVPMKSERPTGKKIEVQEKAWLSSIAIWCIWHHVGSLVAMGACELVAFKVSAIMDALKPHPAILDLSRSFAQTFANLAASGDGAANDLDEPAPTRVLMAMPLQERERFSEAFMEVIEGVHDDTDTTRLAPSRFRGTPQQCDTLREELMLGKCVLALGPDGDPLRTVLLCVLRIHKPNGDMLVKMGSCRGGITKPDCVLPGTKLNDEESAAAAAERVFSQDLPPLQGTLKFSTSVNEETIKRSSLFGIRTRYLKTSFGYTLETEDDRAAPDEEMLSFDASMSVAPRAALMRIGTRQQFPTFEPVKVNLSDGDYTVYAWLSPAEFAAASSPALSEELRAWLNNYDSMVRNDSEELPTESPPPSAPLAVDLISPPISPPSVGSLDCDIYHPKNHQLQTQHV